MTQGNGLIINRKTKNEKRKTTAQNLKPFEL